MPVLFRFFDFINIFQVLTAEMAIGGLSSSALPSNSHLAKIPNFLECASNNKLGDKHFYKHFVRIEQYENQLAPKTKNLLADTDLLRTTSICPRWTPMMTR